jgi:hypothetical protein
MTPAVSEPKVEGSNVVPLVKRERTGAVLNRKVRKLGGGCNHLDGPYYFDEALTEVECGCGAKLNPVFVISRLAAHESRWRLARETYLNLQAEHEKRARCKCQHCGQMTRIRGM